MGNVLLGLLYDADQALEEIYDISRHSYRLNLEGPWDEALLRVPDFREALFEGIHHCWAQGNNVLFADADTLCVKPTTVFGRFDCFMLFSETCAAPERVLSGPYLNAGVMYFPTSMSPSLWEFGRGKWGEAPPDQWDYSQELYNRMYYCQGLLPIIAPELNWAPHAPGKVGEEDACIVHLHLTRGRTPCLHLMQKWEQEGHIEDWYKTGRELGVNWP